LELDLQNNTFFSIFGFTTETQSYETFMARTSVSCCIAEVDSGGEEEGDEESLAGMISGSGIVLPKSFIAGSFTSDISVGKSVCDSVF